MKRPYAAYHSVSGSPMTAIRLLDDLAASLGVSKSAVIEMAIREKARREYDEDSWAYTTDAACGHCACARATGLSGDTCGDGRNRRRRRYWRCDPPRSSGSLPSIATAMTEYTSVIITPEFMASFADKGFSPADRRRFLQALLLTGSQRAPPIVTRPSIAGRPSGRLVRISIRHAAIHPWRLPEG